MVDCAPTLARRQPDRPVLAVSQRHPFDSAHADPKALGRLADSPHPINGRLDRSEAVNFAPHAKFA